MDDAYYPPFPWCLVNVYNLPKTRSVTIRAYIDTGSDGTIVTTAVDKELELHSIPSPSLRPWASAESLR